jgi:hypothetical protein
MPEAGGRCLTWSRRLRWQPSSRIRSAKSNPLSIATDSDFKALKQNHLRQYLLRGFGSLVQKSPRCGIFLAISARVRIRFENLKDRPAEPPTLSAGVLATIRDKEGNAEKQSADARRRRYQGAWEPPAIMTAIGAERLLSRPLEMAESSMLWRA